MHSAIRGVLSGLVMASALMTTGAGASTIVPADPLPFERVHLRATVDNCAFNRGVTVDSAEGVIRVIEPVNACLVPGTPEVVDIQLGAFPAGRYTVEVFASAEPGAEPVERLPFVVPAIVDIQAAAPQQFPRIPRPSADYSGPWWAPNQNGWGLSLHQGALGTLFGSLSVFGIDHQPEWYTVQAGSWSSTTRWSGKLVRTTGPAWSVPPYDPGFVDNAIAGTVSLDFTMIPGREGVARLSYAIGAASVEVDIVRARIF